MQLKRINIIDCLLKLIMANRLLLGFDVGSSSVKASLVNADNGKCVATAFFPEKEAPIMAVKAGWAEQDPQMWWNNAKLSLKKIMADSGAKAEEIKAIGISYQMHGLVCVDKNLKALRPSIIWCDSRAVPYGEKAFKDLGAEQCLSHLLNSPGNFTAAKLAWVKENEPELYSQIYKIMLPGDYIAMRLSGVANTTVSGLSEGMFWDFKNNQVADFLMKYYGFDASLIADIVPTFAEQSVVSAEAAEELGLKAGTPITYRGGDQPNNALSLNVLNPGEVAATAGTSGVVYGISDKVNTDPRSRINMFAHVNHTPEQPHLGVMHCTNGVGIMNAWMRRMVAPQVSYEQFNDMAAQAPIGSDGLTVLPFGNGAERILENRQLGSLIYGLNFNNHDANTLARAAQEGVAFSFQYGMSIMQATGMNTKVIRAGYANMFLSPIFRTTLATVADAVIELYDTDGSVGAATGAALGCGFFASAEEAFRSLRKIDVVTSDRSHHDEYLEAYARWENVLRRELNA